MPEPFQSAREVFCTSSRAILMSAGARPRSIVGRPSGTRKVCARQRVDRLARCKRLRLGGPRASGPRGPATRSSAARDGNGNSPPSSAATIPIGRIAPCRRCCPVWLRPRDRGVGPDTPANTRSFARAIPRERTAIQCDWGTLVPDSGRISAAMRPLGPLPKRTRTTWLGRSSVTPKRRSVSMWTKMSGVPSPRVRKP